MIFYVASYATGLGNVPWQQGELFALDVRGLAPEDKWMHDEARQTLTIVPAKNAPGAVHRITVGVSPAPKEAFVLVLPTF